MQSTDWQKIGLLIAVCLLLVGCGRSDPAERARQDESIAERDLANEGEERQIEDNTGGDYSKSTETQQPDDSYEKAIAELDKAIELSPRSADAYFERGAARLKHRELDMAIEDFRTAIKLDPRHARAYLMRSQAYEALGDRDAAKQDRAKALELDPSIDD